MLDEPTSSHQTEEQTTNPEEKKKQSKSFFEILFVIFILLFGLLYRLYFIFKISGPENAGVGWYGDTYHHWQIAYLTMTTGLKENFLRLWDLKGVEFFWGPLHPLLMVVIFKITGSVNIVLTRLVSIAFGLGSIYLMYELSRRYWGVAVALAILVFGAFFPIAVFNDTTGSLEPLGVFFLLLAVYFWPRQAFFTGISLGISTMLRAEAWVFSLALVIGLMLKKQAGYAKFFVLLGFTLLILFYMKYLLNYTGNPIYPLWWNFLANALGAWAGEEDKLTSLQIQVRPYLISVGAIGFGALIWVLLRKPKSYLYQLLGWGNIFFVGAFIGVGHYLKGYEWWFPVIRFFVFPYLFFVNNIFGLLGRIRKVNVLAGNTILVLSLIVLVLITQFTWIPIMKRFNESLLLWESTVSWGREVGAYYKDGVLLFPEHDPNFTYSVVKYGGIKGDNILGQMFDPYFYMEEDAYKDWNKNREAVLKWLKDHNVKLAVFRNDAGRYIQLREKEPYLFEKAGNLQGSSYEVWRVFPEKIDLK